MTFKKIRVIVTGGRDYKDRRRVFRELDKLCGEVTDEHMLGDTEVTVIHGGCKTGADSFADDWCVVNWTNPVVYAAEWQRWGKAAGPIRNEQMCREAGADLCLAFPGGAGTADCIRVAKR